MRLSPMSDSLETKTTGRTRFLHIIAVLSASHAVYGIITGLTNAISPPEIDDEAFNLLIEQINRFEMPIPALKSEVEHFYVNLMLDMGNYGTANFLFYSIQLIGVILMYQLNRVGFPLYVLAQIGLAASPVIFGGWGSFGQIMLVAALVWNGIWVVMYATQLKYFYR